MEVTSAPPVAAQEVAIDSVRRQACRDQALLSIAHPDAIGQAAEQSVRTLWQESRVKSFIGVLALRDLRATLGADEPAARGDR